MAILTKEEILKAVKSGDIGFKPALDNFQLQAHSVDLRLGFTFLIPKSWQVTKSGRQAIHMDYFATERPEYFDIVELEQGQFFDLLPNEHVLVSSLESIKIPNNLMAIMYPRSSTNRKGISVDLTGIIDSGYEGQLVIPIRNNTQSQVVRLYPGERFCQIVFERLDHEVSARRSRYHQKDIIEGVDTKDQAQKDKKEIKLILKGDIKKLKSENSIS